MKAKTSKICSVCGKPYEYQVKVCYINGEKTCMHDEKFEPSLRFTNHEKKLQNNLPKNKVMVKGRQGISYICDKVKK